MEHIFCELFMNGSEFKSDPTTHSGLLWNLMIVSAPTQIFMSHFD